MREFLLDKTASDPNPPDHVTGRTLQRRNIPNRESGGPTVVPPIVHETLRAPGRPLDPAARAALEPRFGQDFSRVRVHTGAQAGESARSVNALAYTVGQNIVFGAQQYAPHTPDGQRLLAHELAHTVQQRQAAPQTGEGLQVSTPGDASEREAARVSETLTQSRGGGHSVPAAQQFTPSNSGQMGLLQRQEANTPKPEPKVEQKPVQPENKSPNPTPGEGKDQKKPEPTADLATQVKDWLDKEEFDLPAVADPADKTSGQRRALYGKQMSTLDAITDDVTNVLRQKNPGIKRSDVWSQVWQYYNNKKAEAEKKRWQAVVSLLYTPQYTFASNQPIDNPAQHSFQISAGANYRLHPAGASGTELTFQANVSLLNLSAPSTPYFHDIFQNATLSGQVQQVWNLGKDFQITPGQWSNLQASLFAQVALGAGTNYSTAGGDRKLFVGFLAQPSVGGQVNLNIGWFQIIANGAVVYSYLSPTAEKGSTGTSSVAVQGSLGIGGQF